MQNRRLGLVVFLAGFFAILGSTMSKAPTLPLYAKSLGLGLAAIGIVGSASTVTGIFVNFVGGALSDIYGRKRLLVASGVVFSSAPLLYFAARGAGTLLMVRAYYGVATAIFTPVSLALISDMYPERKGVLMGLLSASTLAGRALAPSVAGSLIYTVGFPAVFVSCSAAGFTVLALVSRLPRVTGKTEAKPRGGVLNSTLILIGMVEAASYMGYQALETYIPLFQSMESVEWLSGLTLSLMVATMALFKPAAGYLSDKVGRIKPIIIGLALSAASLTIIHLNKSLPAVVSSVELFAVGLSLTTASTKPLAAEISRYSGAAIGMLESIKDIGQAAGPIIVGVLGMKWGFEAVTLVILTALLAFITVGTISIQYAIDRRNPQLYRFPSV